MAEIRAAAQAAAAQANAGQANAEQMAQLLRLAGVWGLLMVGAILVLAVAVIQLLLAYF